MATEGKKSILFVCLGNICRSPLAQAAFLKLVTDKGIKDRWIIDSCATADYHVGREPDERALKVIGDKGIEEYSHKARQLSRHDYDNFHYIMAMDEQNLHDLNCDRHAGSGATIRRLGEYDPKKHLNVRDPYYDSGDEGFYECYTHVMRSCEAFLAGLDTDAEKNENDVYAQSQLSE